MLVAVVSSSSLNGVMSHIATRPPLWHTGRLLPKLLDKLARVVGCFVFSRPAGDRASKGGYREWHTSGQSRGEALQRGRCASGDPTTRVEADIGEQ